MLQMGTVPRRHDERQCVGPDLHLKEKRTLAPVDSRAHVGYLGISADDAGVDEAASVGDRREIGSVSGMRFLHAGLPVALVVQNDNAEVPGPLHADRSETP